MLEGEISHDKVTRFLRLNEFRQYVKKPVRARERSGGVLIKEALVKNWRGISLGPVSSASP